MDPPENPPPKMLTRTFFRVKFPTEVDEHVIVVGSDSHLGAWNVNKAHKLISSEEHLTVWYSSTPVPLPLNKTIQYKYAAYNPTSQKIRWESQEVNRTIKPTGETMHVEDDNGLFRLINQIHVPLTDDEDGVSQFSRQIEAQKKYEQLMNDVKLDGDNYLHIVSMELPIKVGRTENDEFFVESRKSSLIPTLYNLQISTPFEVKFFGWPGIHPTSIDEKERLIEWLDKHNCVPIFPSEEVLKGCLEFCNNFLWPIFHNVMPVNLEILEPKTNELWKNYNEVNQAFAEVIGNHSRETDMIWIHNFHHLTLPHFLTRRSKRLNIGLFLHIPFPSNEVFRCIPMREQLLKGMLFADLLGFHIFEYAYNFFGACAYLSGYQQTPRFGGGFTLECDGRNVSVHVNHVHIQYEDVRKKIEGSDMVKQRTHKIQQSFKDKFIFASVDRCEIMAGLIHKFLAFQSLLTNYASCRGKAVLIQYAYPIPSMKEQTQKYQKELEELANSINKKFQTKENEKHIFLHVGEISWEEKFSLFQATDCFLDTSISDGFNMNPSEFICCRKDRPASLILSEFIGCARSHSSSIRINPWQIEEVANMMDKVIHHPDSQAKWEAFNRDQEYLKLHTTFEWAFEFLKDLKKAKKPINMNYVLCGFALSSRLVGTPLSFSWLDSNLVIDALKVSKRRYFFFDYEGTLAFDRRRVNALPDHNFDTVFSNGISPLEGVKTCLRELLSDVRNTVVILSGRDISHLEKWFNGVDRLGLCAEHGYYYKVPSLTDTHWHCVSNNVDLTWKDMTREILSHYVKRTQGSFIENKGSALVFQYRDAHPEFGLYQANDLSIALKSILSGYPVSVVQGKGYVEVRLYGINKGQAVKNILDKLTSSYGEADFILCIGDDRSDEDMFEEINKRDENYTRSRNGSIDNEEAFFNSQLSNTFMSNFSSDDLGPLFNSSSMETNLHKRLSTSSSSPNSGNPRRYFTCTVGQKSSKARYYLNDTGEVTTLLSSIVTAMHKMSGTHTC